MEKLSRQQILDEPAGSKLDSWVAEKVMGWRIEGSAFPGPGIWAEDDNHKFMGYLDHLHVPSFCPSVSIQDAWQVVEKMKDRFRFSLWDNMPGWRADFNTLTINRGRADTAPLAICRAALLARGGKGKMKDNIICNRADKCDDNCCPHSVSHSRSKDPYKICTKWGECAGTTGKVRCVKVKD